ncbi:MAG: hypothetical protein OXC93_03465 [Rhodospirillaceae bacterium]|nr:hypothetical protein [Rhodospirillaceae bacterium]
MGTPTLKPILIAALMMLLLLSIGVAWHVWSALDDISMPIHGYLALTAGVVFSLIVGGGLMALVFYSARRGYDDLEDRTPRDCTRARE